MIKRTFYRLFRPNLIRLLDAIKTDSPHSYSLDSTKKQFDDSLIESAKKQGLIEIKDESIGIAVGDWSPTRKVLKLTGKSKPVAKSDQEKEKSTQSRSDAVQKITIRVSATLIAALLLYFIASTLNIKLGS